MFLAPVRIAILLGPPPNLVTRPASVASRITIRATMVEPIKNIAVSHLGGIQVGFRMSSPALDASKPTLVLFIPFTTTADYYLPEFENQTLRSALNLIAIEPLGHGQTRTKATESFNYWDSAIMSFQLLDALGIEKVFALGTSQGGWIAARMALLYPDRIKGIIALGSSMDSESPKSQELGCWDALGACSGLLALAGDPAVSHDFEPGDAYYDYLMEIGYGNTIDKDTKDFWTRTIKSNYNGDEGKRRICMAAVALTGRDSLHGRLPYIKCPVLWMQGTDDVVFSVPQAEADIARFTNSVKTKFIPCQGGVHFLSRTHGEMIQRELLEFIFNQSGSVKSVL